MSNDYKKEFKSKGGSIALLIVGATVTPFNFIMTIGGFATGENVVGVLFLVLLAATLFCMIKGIIGIKSVGRHNREVQEKYKDVIEAEKRAREEAKAAKAALEAEKKEKSDAITADKSGSLSTFADGTVGELLFELDGRVTSILQVYEDRCILIAKTTARSYIAGKFFNGTKEFFYEDLINIQFREATKIINGYLEFEYAGANAHSGNNHMSENAFVFSPNSACPDEKFVTDAELAKTNAYVSEIYKYIHDKIVEEKKNRKNGAAPVVQQISTSDELKKYHELMTSGVITPEEFEKKKKELLG